MGEEGYDFAGLSDYHLIEMQKEVRRLPEDKEFLQAILVELGRRHIAQFLRRRRPLEEKEKEEVVGDGE